MDPLRTLTETYAYDPVGNRTASHLATGQLHDAANRLLEDSTFTYTYDASGNLITKTTKASCATTTYTYDEENRLIQVQTPTLTALHRYDPLGRRIAKGVTQAGTTTSTRYIYDNEDILLELDGANVIQARYTHGPGIDEPLIMLRGGASFFYHPDGLGSIGDLTDGAGAAARSYTYDSFGNILAQPGTVPNPYTYTGREVDAESGLYFYRSRNLNPNTGTFLTQDRIGFVGGINFYAYVMNNPISLIDPLGFLKFSWGVGGVLGIFDVNWNSANPLETSVNLVTPQLGAGFNFCATREGPSQPVTVGKPVPQQGCTPSREERSKQIAAEAPLEELPFTYSIGKRYLGFSFTDDFKTFCINLGLAEGPLPVNISVPWFAIEAK